MKMDRNVLLLNQNYEPLAFCNAKKAIVLIFLGKAEAVENDNVEVHSVNFRMPMPLVVRLSRHARTPRRRVILNRKNLLIRDGHACQYCGKSTPPLTIDHIVPRQRGGGERGRRQQRQRDFLQSCHDVPPTLNRRKTSMETARHEASAW